MRPLPNSSPQQQTILKRLRKTAILTDTPDENVLADEQTKKKTKKIQTLKTSQHVKVNLLKKGKRNGKGKAKRKVLKESDSDKDLEW